QPLEKRDLPGLRRIAEASVERSVEGELESERNPQRRGAGERTGELRSGHVAVRIPAAPVVVGPPSGIGEHEQYSGSKTGTRANHERKVSCMRWLADCSRASQIQPARPGRHDEGRRFGPLRTVLVCVALDAQRTRLSWKSIDSAHQLLGLAVCKDSLSIDFDRIGSVLTAYVKGDGLPGEHASRGQRC